MKDETKEKLDIAVGIAVIAPYVLLLMAARGYLWLYHMGCFLITDKGWSLKPFWTHWKEYKEHADSEFEI